MGVVTLECHFGDLVVVVVHVHVGQFVMFCLGCRMERGRYTGIRRGF